jgi:hypothetical protein
VDARDKRGHDNKRKDYLMKSSDWPSLLNICRQSENALFHTVAEMS